MSAPAWQTVPARVVPDAARRRARAAATRRAYAGLLRLTLHRLRVPGALAVLLTAGAIGWGVLVRERITSAERAFAATPCDAATVVRCSAAIDRVDAATRALSHYQWACLALPLLAGAFLGAPLVAQEVERGTHRLLWTQAASRTRWLTVRLAVPGTLVLLLASALAATVGWASRPHAGSWSSGWGVAPFHAGGPVAVAAALFALALGTMAGAALRRTVPAMAATTAGCTVVGALLQRLRPHLLPVHHLVQTHGLTLRGDFWMLSDGRMLPDGTKVPYADCTTSACLASGRVYEDFHSAAQWWPMQWAESGLLLLLTAAAVAGGYRLVHRSVR